MEIADTSFTELLKEVHRARERTRCDYIIVTVRGARVSAALSVPSLDRPDRRYTAHLLFGERARPELLVPFLCTLTPAAVVSSLVVAAAHAGTTGAHAAFSDAVVAYTDRLSSLGVQP